MSKFFLMYLYIYVSTVIPHLKSIIHFICNTKSSVLNNLRTLELNCIRFFDTIFLGFFTSLPLIFLDSSWFRVQRKRCLNRETLSIRQYCFSFFHLTLPRLLLLLCTTITTFALSGFNCLGPSFHLIEGWSLFELIPFKLTYSADNLWKKIVHCTWKIYYFMWIYFSKLISKLDTLHEFVCE